MVMNCGFEAGRVYRYLLKVLRYGDEICDIESSEGVPPCHVPESDDSEREKIPNIYYGLLHRFGNIPEQADEFDSSESSSETTKPADEFDSSESPSETTKPADEFDSSESSSETTKPDAVQVKQSVIADLIREALGSIEENHRRNTTLLQTLRNLQRAEFNVNESFNTEDEFDIYRRPIITEPFKGLLHYNYSGRDFAIYWKQPNVLTIKNVKCEHMLPSYFKFLIFDCLLHRKLHDPPCLAVGRSQNEEITPELVRDIDPDVPDDSSTKFGPRPFWMDELDEYKKQKDLRELAEKLSGAKSFKLHPDSEAETPVSIDCTSEIILDPAFDWLKCHALFSESLRNEIVSVLLPNLHEDDTPEMLVRYDNDIGHAYFFEDILDHFENIDCGRVNECHDVFRCTFKPRVINRFFQESRNLTPAFDILRNFFRRAQIKQSNETELESVERSGFSVYETSSENVVTVLFAESETPVTEHDPDLYTEDVVAEGGEFVRVDASSRDSMESETPDSSDIRLMILDSPVKDSDEKFQYFEDFVHSGDESVHEESETYELASNDADGYRLSENVLLLQPISSNSNDETSYEIIQPEENDSTYR